MNEILDVVHKTIYQFFDICDDEEETPISDKDKLLLEVNKAICNNLKALEQQPCEDCISRERVIQLIIGNEFPSDDRGGRDIDSDVLYDAVQNLPSVTPKLKMGKWIADVDKWGDIITAVNGYRCDKCNSFNPDKDNFCPNCGTKMNVLDIDDGKMADFPQAKDIESAVKGFINTMDIIDDIGKAESEDEG